MFSEPYMPELRDTLQAARGRQLRLETRHVRQSVHDGAGHELVQTSSRKQFKPATLVIVAATAAGIAAAFCSAIANVRR
jgi:hypothetical protein